MWLAHVHIFHAICLSLYLVNLSVRSIGESTEFKEVNLVSTKNRVYWAFNLQIYFEKCDGTLLVLEADSRVLRHITYNFIEHLCRTLDLAHTLCAILETWVFLWHLVLPTFVIYTSHLVQAALNPSVNYEYSKFTVAATLSNHSFFFNQTRDKYQNKLWTNKS